MFPRAETSRCSLGKHIHLSFSTLYTTFFRELVQKRDTFMAMSACKSTSFHKRSQQQEKHAETSTRAIPIFFTKRPQHDRAEYGRRQQRHPQLIPRAPTHGGAPLKRRIGAPAPSAAIIDSIDLKACYCVHVEWICVSREAAARERRSMTARAARRAERSPHAHPERPTVARPGQTRVAVARPRAARWHGAGTPAGMTDVRSPTAAASGRSKK